MKARLDFVSNSSSTSFMLVGCAFEITEIAEGWKKLHPEDFNRVDNEYDYYELANSLASELELVAKRGISDYYDMWVLGLPFGKMHDDETKRAFKERISTALKKAFNDVEVKEIVDGGYDS